MAIRDPGCRFACPGLCATLGFQPVLAKSETSINNIQTAREARPTQQSINVTVRELYVISVRHKSGG